MTTTTTTTNVATATGAFAIPTTDLDSIGCWGLPPMTTTTTTTTNVPTATVYETLGSHK